MKRRIKVYVCIHVCIHVWYQGWTYVKEIPRGKEEIYLSIHMQLYEASKETFNTFS